MVWTKITIETREDTAEILGGILLAHGIDAWETLDVAPEPDPFTGKVYPELQPNIKERDSVRVRFYLDEEEDVTAIIYSIREACLSSGEFEEDELQFKIASSDERDWRDAWKEHFHSFAIDDVWIVPTWEEIPEEAKDKHVVRMDPGISFGSGTHESTRLCVQGLQTLDLQGKKVLDLGCGSGILSIVSILLGAEHVTAIDIDPDAANASENNLKDNQIDANRYDVYTGNLLMDLPLQKQLADASYDVIVTNILADVIIELLPIIKKKLKQGGVLITSGIIDFKEEAIRTAIKEQGLVITDVRVDQEWVSIVGTRP